LGGTWRRSRALRIPNQNNNKKPTSNTKNRIGPDQQKLTPLLRLKYGAIQDAIAALGQPEEIGRAFAGFQKYLYAEIVP
jgi:hypothetical protein